MDRAGHVKAFLDGLTSRNIEFSVTGRYNPDVADVIAEIDPDTWLPARTVDGERRTGACVAEVDVLPAGPPRGHGSSCAVRRPIPVPNSNSGTQARGATSVSSRTRPAAVSRSRRTTGHMPGSRTTSRLSKTRGSNVSPASRGQRTKPGSPVSSLPVSSPAGWPYHLLDGDLTTATPATLRYTGFCTCLAAS